MTNYADFLSRKSQRVPTLGRDCSPDEVNPILHQWQREMVAWAVRTGRAAMWEDTGLGKTFQQIEWARLSAPTSLVVAPLAVCQQTVREAAKLGVTARYIRHSDAVDGAGVYVTNYEQVHNMAADIFGAVVLDECFAAGTRIDTPDGAKPIDDLRVGDHVKSAVGTAKIWDVHRREVPYAVAVTARGRQTVCSPNHPWFTQRGWVCAQDLEPGDSLVDQAQAVRMVRAGVCEEVRDSAPDRAFLRAVLLSEMADAATGTLSEGAQSKSGSQAWRQPLGVPAVRIAGSDARVRPYSAVEPDERPSCEREDLPPIESHEPSTFRAWGKWSGDDAATVDAAGNTWRFVAGGALCVTGQADTRLSHALQARSRELRSESRYRVGWQLPLFTQGARSEEGREAGFTRVDGVEVLEPSDPRLDSSRDADGRLYFYDLGVEGHPSYSVGGHLVHNSSILKQSDGKTRTMLIDWARDIPHRLACSATPAPNDPEELTNQAEWLGRMSRTHMLAAYFIHDQDGWRLKGHARGPMMRWMAQWAVALTRPSDVGGDDTGYILPGLEVVPEVVTAEIEVEGQLFATDIGGVTGRAELRRKTLRARVDRAAKLVANEPGPWLLWCGLNIEADELAEAIPGAVNVHGSLDPDEKARLLLDFADRKYDVLITKPSIASQGLNYQHCSRMAFVGLGDSYEQYYQAIRRCYRYGQTKVVRAHVIVSDLESQIAANVARKEQQASQIQTELVAEMRRVRAGK